MKSSLIPPSVVLVVICGALPAPGTAQGQYVRLQGRVQWIAADTMMCLPASGAMPVNVDLRQVPLNEYATLAQGNPIVVDGMISEDGRRLIARSVAVSPLDEEAP